MLGNCEKKKMLIIPSSSSSTTNEWPQQQIDEKSLMPSTSKVMEKRVQELSQQQQQQQQIHLQPPPQQALKCPRCDSSNTKFCYYNNYSLSQPRHFCKACKRYWTRGGTLRNVPVGGGCRKNKRVKRPISTSTVEGGAGTSVSNNPNNHPLHTQIDISSSTSNHINPLFYGLPTNPSEMNLAFPGRFNSRNMDSVSGFDLQPQFGLGFSSNNNSVFNPSKQIQDVVSNYSNIFGSSSNSSASPTMATLLASSLTNNQQKLSMKEARAAGPNSNLYQSLTSFEDFQSNESGMKEVKIEQEHHNRSLAWNIPCQNQIDPIGIGFSTSDPSSSLYWNTNSVGAWHDPGNIGSSVTSLI